LGAFSLAVTRPGDERRATNAPPIKVLLCMLVASGPLPGLLELIKGGLVIVESFMAFSLNLGKSERARTYTSSAGKDVVTSFLSASLDYERR
jgi:hypothetical protein